ncbi:MAG: hypothetical protein K0Q55_394 [Verrucomicrobia bacterium]|jgi:hypothetical protein|nr:hypothetical protein [Verrucomicrobiota bacterium]
MQMFSPATVEFLQTYGHDQAFRWTPEDLAAQAQFAEQALAGVAWCDWSDPGMALPLLQAAMLNTPTALEHDYDGILLAGPLSELMPAEALIPLAQAHLNPAGRLVGIIPCLRDNSPESQRFMDLAAEKLWPYHTAEIWLELLQDAGFEAARIKGEFIARPQFAASALTGKLHFAPFAELFREVEKAGYGANEVGWGELRFVAMAEE